MPFLALMVVMGASGLAVVMTMKQTGVREISPVILLKVFAMDFVMWLPLLGAYWLAEYADR